MKETYKFINIPSGDLRISITDSCNMKCVYCHNEGQSKQDVFINVDDFKYIVKNSIDYGIHKIRLTGGEPTIHPNFKEIVDYLQGFRDKVEIGINTNLVEYEEIEKIVKEHLIDRIVVGVDYYDGKISKKSLSGLSSNIILERIIQLKQINPMIKIDIDTVFLGDIDNIIALCSWANTKNIIVKILEINDIHAISTQEYDSLINILSVRFGLKKGLDVHLNEYYLYDDSNSQCMVKIRFFQSHCNRNECDICKKMHLRVQATGYAKPCIYRDDTVQDLLHGDFNLKMSKAIYYMGEKYR